MTMTLTETTVPAPAPVLDENDRRVLATAKGIVANGWCQGNLDDGEGNYCAIGAIMQAITGEMPSLAHRRYSEALVIAGDLRANQRPSDDELHPLAAWNDAPGRTQAEVVALFDKALGA